MLCFKHMEMIDYLEMIKNYCDARGTCFECVFNDHGKGCMFWHGGIAPCDWCIHALAERIKNEN